MCAVWERANGAGSFAGIAGRFAKALAPLKAAGHEPPAIAARLGVYLERNESRFWSIERFVSTYSQWDSSNPPRNAAHANGKPNLGGDRNDAVLKEWLAEKQAARAANPTGGENGE